jgi:opacity protein-like surface antigen
MKSFILLCVFVFSCFAQAQSADIFADEQLGTVDFGRVHRREKVSKDVVLPNPTSLTWQVPMIQVSGPGYSLAGANRGIVPPNTDTAFGVNFTAGANFKNGVYKGKCKLYVKWQDGTIKVYYYNLKAQVVPDDPF